MLFETDNLSVDLLDVFELKQDSINFFNKGRTFDALSFRFCADTVIKNDKESFYLKDNSVLFVPSRVDYTRISKRDDLIVIHFNTNNKVFKKLETFEPQNSEVLATLFREILECWAKKEQGYKYNAKALFYRILAEIYKEFHNENSDTTIMDKSLIYINENFTSPDFSVKEASEKSNISEVYFRKLFKEKYGISPKKYVIEKRIKRAVNLIESGYFRLDEIATMCGYTDYKYFSVQFHSIMGMPPSKYYYKFTLPNFNL